jgi:hypothetical protein
MPKCPERSLPIPRGLGKTIIIVKDTVDALGRLANWKRKRDGSLYIGITGSFGKTTLKHVLSQTLSNFMGVFESPGNFNNLIGLPLSMLMKNSEEVGIFELGISERGEMEIGRWVGFYITVLTMILLQTALFIPSSRILGKVGMKTGQGPAILIPVSFLLLGFLYGFLKARGLLRQNKTVASFGWLLGSAALNIILLLFYLLHMTDRF